MVRKIIVTIILIVSALFSWNYFSLQKNISHALNSDSRNIGINVYLYFDWFVNPNIIVFDIRDVSSDKSPMDVSRLLLQISEKLKQEEYEKIILAYKGQSKFILKGEFFKKTGLEYGNQNPMYTLRTLPQNVYNLDGTSAFPTWTGGLFGVLGKQMEDLNEFNKHWYINDLTSK
ncbi:hypothetical protein [Thalassotalea agariperforans]